MKKNNGQEAVISYNPKGDHIKAKLTLRELKIIVYDYLQLTPMWLSLSTLLQANGYIQSEHVESEFAQLTVSKVIDILESTQFLIETAKFTNRKNTFVNIQLIKTSIILSKRYSLNGREIMHAVNSYTLSCRQYRTDFLELSFDKIRATLRLVNKTIALKVFLVWFLKMKPYLYCLQTPNAQFRDQIDEAKKNYESRMNIQLDSYVQEGTTKNIQKPKPSQIMGLKGESAQLVDSMEKMYILPHEFLYLLCNSTERLKIIEENHKIDLKGQKAAIHFWELQQPKTLESQGKKIFPVKVKETVDDKGVKTRSYTWDLNLKKSRDTANIILLSPNAFNNKAPNYIVDEQLNKITENLSIKDAINYVKEIGGGNDYKAYIDKKMNADLAEIKDYYKEKSGLNKRKEKSEKSRRTVIVQNRRSLSKTAEYKKIDQDSKKEKVVIVNIESIPYDVDAVQEETQKIQYFIQQQYDRDQYKVSKLKQTRNNEDSPINKKDHDSDHKPQAEYDPKVYKNEHGQYDFSKAPGYNEDIVRHNINKVKHTESFVCIEPTAVKFVPQKQEIQFVSQNIDSVQGTYKPLNRARIFQIREETKSELNFLKKEQPQSIQNTQKNLLETMPKQELETSIARNKPAQVPIEARLIKSISNKRPVSTSFKKYSDKPISRKNPTTALDTTTNSSQANEQRYGSSMNAQEEMRNVVLGNYLKQLGTVPTDVRTSKESPLQVFAHFTPVKTGLRPKTALLTTNNIRAQSQLDQVCAIVKNF